jgi:hypothetical protein
LTHTCKHTFIQIKSRINFLIPHQINIQEEEEEEEEETYYKKIQLGIHQCKWVDAELTN